MKSVQCKTQWHVIVAHLWRLGTWQPTHLLQPSDTEYGFIGSSGEQRVRELARNAPCVPAILRDKVENRRGSEIGLRSALRVFQVPLNTAVKCARFEAGLSADQVFAV